MVEMEGLANNNAHKGDEKEMDEQTVLEKRLASKNKCSRRC